MAGPSSIMDALDEGQLERTSSNRSIASTKSRRSERARVRSQAPTPPPDKGLTSFPSLSPDPSPKDARVDAPNKVQPSSSPAPSSMKTTASAVSVLTGSTPSTHRRTALFNDSPLGEHLVPGTLHHTTDEHIERLAAKNGAVALIRQLAEDLAQRDAQMSALQRRAEEREKVLRKMLRECEVSNMDIEARLHRATLGTAQLGEKEKKKGGKSGENLHHANDHDNDASSADGTIDEMVDQAMRDALVGDADNELSSLDVDSLASRSIRHVSLGTESAATTVEDDARSAEPPTSATMRKTKRTSRGWMDYIWAGTGTSRTSSGASSMNGETAEDPMATAKPKRASTLATRRAGLSGDLFQAPSGNASTSRPVSRTEEGSGAPRTESRQTSTSVTSWAVKLVAGNGKATVDERRPSGDGWAASPRRASAGAGKPMESAKAALSKLSGTHRGGSVAHRSATSLSIGPNGTIRSGGSKYAPAASSPTSPALVRGPASASGPVEMDAILPPDTQPPTLHHTYNYYHPTDFVTDRFGFIYDQRRRWRKNDGADEHHGPDDDGRRAEMLSPVTDRVPDPPGAHEAVSDEVVDDPASPPSDSRPDSPASHQEAERSPPLQAQPQPSRRWQDHLKIATFPTELLSDTPAGGRMPTVQTSESHVTRAQITVANGGTLLPARLHPPPAASTVVAENATFARSGGADAVLSAAPKKPAPEPVRMLVEQLTELHDSLQRERTIKWNEFLRKVRAERRRQGEAAVVSDGRPDSRLMPEATLADGEVIGVAGLGNKGKIGRAKWNEFKQLVLSGIPVAHRAKIWAECSGAWTLRTPGSYDDLVQHGVDDPVIVAQIGMDVHRTLTDNVFFRDGPGVGKLHEVLHAYARRNPEIGYCQGMNLIVASLLLIVPTAEDAFWLLTSMVENILPAHYYDRSLLASRADQQVLRQYVAQLLPRLSAHLDDLGIELEALTFQWFLSVFTGCLSAEALFRVWDVVLCTNDGSTFLFQVALALLSLNEQALLDCTSPAGVYSYLDHQMTNHAISIDGLIRASDALKKVVTRGEVEERREKVMERESAGRRPVATSAESVRSMD